MYIIDQTWSDYKNIKYIPCELSCQRTNVSYGQGVYC